MRRARRVYLDTSALVNILKLVKGNKECCDCYANLLRGAAEGRVQLTLPSIVYLEIAKIAIQKSHRIAQLARSVLEELVNQQKRLDEFGGAAYTYTLELRGVCGLPNSAIEIKSEGLRLRTMIRLIHGCLKLMASLTKPLKPKNYECRCCKDCRGFKCECDVQDVISRLSLADLILLCLGARKGVTIISADCVLLCAARILNSNIRETID